MSFRFKLLAIFSEMQFFVKILYKIRYLVYFNRIVSSIVCSSKPVLIFSNTNSISENEHTQIE